MPQDWRHSPPPDLSPILRVALERFTRHGYEAASVRMIARDAGVTVPALYYHFQNKQAILAALMDRAMSIVSAHVDGALARAGDDPADRLRAVVEAIVLYMAHYQDIARLESERRSLTEDNLAVYIARRDRIERELRSILEDGCARGVFRTPVPRTCVRAILGMCQAVAGWYRPDGPRSPEEIAEDHVRVALAAVEYAHASP